MASVVKTWLVKIRKTEKIIFFLSLIRTVGKFIKAIKLFISFYA